MKLLIFVLVTTLIAHQEAALLAHPKGVHNVVSLAAQKDSQESENNITLEQALEALPPVPNAFKAFLIMRLGQNISNLIRIGSNHTDETRSLRGTGSKLGTVLRVEADPTSPDIHTLEGSAGAAELLRKLLKEAQEKLDAEHARWNSFKRSKKREVAQASLAVAQSTADANKAHGEVLLVNGRLASIRQQLPRTREVLQRHMSACEKSQGLLRSELSSHSAEQSQMEIIVGLAECTETTTLIQCPSKRRGEHIASLFSFGNLPIRQAVARLKLAATRQAVQEAFEDAYRTATDLKEDPVVMPNASSMCFNTFGCPSGANKTDDGKGCAFADGTECDLGYCAGEPKLNMMSCSTGPPKGDGSVGDKCWNSLPCPFLMVRSGDGSVCAPGDPQAKQCGLGDCAGEGNPNSTLPQCSTGSVLTTSPPLEKVKCTLKTNPDCPKLADRLMYMLSYIVSRVTNLQRVLLRMETGCKKTEENEKDQISNLVKLEAGATADLALATKTLNENTVSASQKTVEFEGLTNELTRERSTCWSNIANINIEMCSIKKIRKELFNLASMTKEVRDCQVSQWTSSECTVTCGAGTMRRSRTIEIPPLEGAPCPPLVEEVDCDIPPGCPEPCKLGTWSGWTECSSGCGGGVKQRNREIEQNPLNGGDPCDSTSESQTCNLQACNVPCVLKPWTSWSKCSKQCGKGHRSRVRSIEHEAVGEGHCPLVRGPERLETMPCNTQACTPAEPPYLHCASKIDLVLILDGSGSIQSSGFQHVKQFALKLIDTLQMGQESTVLSVLLFGGPRTYDKMYACKNGSVTDLGDCGIKWVTGNSSLPKWTADKLDVIHRIQDLKWPKGGTLTGMALDEAKNELANSRKDAPSTVLVVTDGKPSYPSSTLESARSVRDTARLMWVAVGPSVKFSDFEALASHPLEENVLPNANNPPSQNVGDLELPRFHNMIIENLCPQLT